MKYDFLHGLTLVWNLIGHFDHMMHASHSLKQHFNWSISICAGYQFL